MFQSLYTHPNGLWVPRNTIYRYSTQCVALFRANQSMKSRIDGPLSTWNTRGGAAKVPWSDMVHTGHLKIALREMIFMAHAYLYDLRIQYTHPLQVSVWPNSPF